MSQPEETKKSVSATKYGLQALIWLVVIIISSTVVLRIFSEQWSHLFSTVAMVSHADLANSATKKIVLAPANNLEPTKVATISATFLTDLFTAIMEATADSELATPSAKLH